METTIGSFIPNMKVKSQLRTNCFTDISNLSIKRKNKQNLSKRSEKDKLAAIDNEVKAYQRKIVSENKDKLIGKILNMSIDPVIPDEIVKTIHLNINFT